METTYYTLNAREIVVSGAGVEKVCGGARQLVCVRRSAAPAREPGRGKVIDLAAWRDRQEREDRPEEAVEECARERESAPRPQPRQRRGGALLTAGELLASLSVVGVMVLLMIRILGG